MHLGWRDNYATPSQSNMVSFGSTVSEKNVMWFLLN